MHVCVCGLHRTSAKYHGNNSMLLNIGIMGPCVFLFLQHLAALKATASSCRLTFLGVGKFRQSVVHWVSEIDICVIVRHIWFLPGALLSRELAKQTSPADVPVSLASFWWWLFSENTRGNHEIKIQPAFIITVIIIFIFLRLMSSIKF